MTIGGALSELNNLLKADDIPFYYKPSIKAVIDTVILSSSEKSNNLDTLNKIRERIDLEKLGYPPSAGYYKAIMKCLQIIDKYRAESEE